MNELNKVTLLAAQNLDKFIKHFDLEDLKLRGNKFVGCCPIHGGDNRTAFNLWAKSGKWVCRTHGCQNVFKPTVIGFIRGMLSRKELDWSFNNDEKYPFTKTIYFVKTITGEADITLEYKPFKPRQEQTEAKEKYKISIADHKKEVIIPCPFYSKVYNKEILEKHMIGFCSDHKSKMYLRTAVPIFSLTGEYIVGKTGRSIFDKCKKCSFYHNTGKCIDSPKWRHDFLARDSLYNYWNIKPQTKQVILTESIGNVLRIEEAGFYNCMALYGAYITDFRKKILVDKGIEEILFIKDTGEPGQILSDFIYRDWSSTFKIKVPEPIWKDDIAELNKQKVKGFLECYL